MKSGKGEGDGYRKEKKYGSGYMYFSYICNQVFQLFTVCRCILLINILMIRVCFFQRVCNFLTQHFCIFYRQPYMLIISKGKV